MKANHAVHLSELMMCAALILNVFLMSLKNHTGSSKIVLINELQSNSSADSGILMQLSLGEKGSKIC